MVRWAVHNAMPDGRDLDEHLRQLQRAGLAGRTIVNVSCVESRDAFGRRVVLFLLSSRW